MNPCKMSIRRRPLTVARLDGAIRWLDARLAKTGLTDRFGAWLPSVAARDHLIVMRVGLRWGEEIERRILEGVR